MNVEEILKKLVSYNTIKDKENNEIIVFIENYLKGLGFKTESKNKNLIMSIKENQKIGFLGHTDTVEFIDGWNTNPFNLTEKNGYLYGLGACDMKGGIAAILKAVSEIDFSKIKYGMKLYFTYDEEIGFKGMYEIVNSKENFPEVMIFGEPTNNEKMIGSKGLLEYKINFYGIKAHSSNPSKGLSANLNAVKFLNELDEFYEKDIKTFNNISFEIPYTTMNIGTINGGSAINSVPAYCNALIDFRIADEKHISKIKNEIEELSKKYNAKAEIIQCIKPFINKTSLVNKIKTTNFITEASLINKNKNENPNLTRIILGPGPVTAHEVNENISKDSLIKTVEIYKKMIMQVCNDKS